MTLGSDRWNESIALADRSAKLQAELLQPETVAYIARAVESEVKKAMAAWSNDSTAIRNLLD